MLRIIVLAALSAAAGIGADTSVNGLWSELKSKRDALSSVHQEFAVTQTFKTSHGEQASKRQVVVDLAPGRWRETSVSGSGKRIRIFDGSDLFTTEEDSDEYVRAKRRAKDEDPQPAPYRVGDPDWGKSKEIERLACGIPGRDDRCVVLEAPLKPSTRIAGNSRRQMLGGTERVILDLGNGLLLSLRMIETIDDERGGYQSDVSYKLLRMQYGTAPDASLFKLPSADMREVKELSRWNAAKIKKRLAGNPAPDLQLTDIQGKPVSLAAFKGRTVLLDFFTTWCPPCRKDAPALDKLYSKYGERDLTIVGISVSEDRPIVEKFLKEHPHNFPVVLTSENDMPREYEIAVFPTYIVIDSEGTLTSAVEGDQGFSDLRKLLKKAGLEVN